MRDTRVSPLPPPPRVPARTKLVFLRTCGHGCGGRERLLGPALVLRLVPVIFTCWIFIVLDVKGPASQRRIFGFGYRPAAS